MQSTLRVSESKLEENETDGRVETYTTESDKPTTTGLKPTTTTTTD
jgi:hypothetical protein